MGSLMRILLVSLTILVGLVAQAEPISPAGSLRCPLAVVDFYAHDVYRVQCEMFEKMVSIYDRHGYGAPKLGWVTFYHEAGESVYSIMYDSSDRPYEVFNS